MRLTYHPDAEIEVHDAARFYERRALGLGDRFLKEFDEAITTIQASPERSKVIESDLRRRLLRTFPYGILYRVNGDEVRILAVMHLSRQPGYWKDRLGR